MAGACFWRSIKMYVFLVALLGMAGLYLGNLVLSEVVILQYQVALIFAYLLFALGSPLLIAIGWIGGFLLVTGRFPKAIETHSDRRASLRPRTLGAAVLATAAVALLAAVFFVAQLFRVSAAF